MTEPRARFVWIGLCTAVFTAACDPAEETPPEPTPSGPIELQGSWHSNFGGAEVITETTWASSTIVEHDNQANSAILQAPADDLFNPSKFSKIVWTEPVAGRFQYCTVDFGLTTLAEAKLSPRTADAAQLNTGCGGFPWTVLEFPIEVAGQYSSTFGSTETIDSDLWMIVGGGYDVAQTVIEYDNQSNTAILQNPEDDAFNPSKFAKVVWTEPAASAFHYCTIDYGQETATLARTSTKTADAQDLDGQGCGGFPWTKLTLGGG